MAQFAADAYLNEMGISTRSCSKGVSVAAFSVESAPNGHAMPATQQSNLVAFVRSL